MARAYGCRRKKGVRNRLGTVPDTFNGPAFKQIVARRARATSSPWQSHGKMKMSLKAVEAWFWLTLLFTSVSMLLKL